MYVCLCATCLSKYLIMYIYFQAMKCFSSWVEFGLPLPEVQGFIGQLLQGLLNEELFSQSCETLTDIVSKEDSMK